MLPPHYELLYQALLRRNWQDADIATRELMLKIAGVEGREDLLLTKADMANFPCLDLQRIDKLWQRASGGKFGFRVTHKLYHSQDCDYKTLAAIAGWRNGEDWISWDQINFSLDAPQGHLPLTWLVPTTFSMYWCTRFASAGWGLMFHRLETCEL